MSDSENPIESNVEQEQLWKIIIQRASEVEGQTYQKLNKDLRSLYPPSDDRAKLIESMERESRRLVKANELIKYPVRMFLHQSKSKVARTACVLFICLVLGTSTAIAFPNIIDLCIQFYAAFIEVISDNNNEAKGSYFIGDSISMKIDFIPKGYYFNDDLSIIGNNSTYLEFIKDEDHYFTIKYYNGATTILIDPEKQKSEKRLINGSSAVFETDGASSQITWAVGDGSTVTIEGKNITESTLIKIAEGIQIE